MRGDMRVPQHDRPSVGKEMIEARLGWIEHPEYGIDLPGPGDYQAPK
ncbi:hypothetical protein GCM10017624_44370 [Azotobacter vinelandii]|nr:hypothetical protein GCM10017624_44370 [Azotobacter vinelandii]SFX45237.1 hypothetical protein SAMN04244547_01631 [Azotobacter vinelandii]